MDDSEILRLFADSEDPFLFTGEVADEIGFTTSGTLKRLNSLADDGYLNVKRSGKVPGWWLSEDGQQVLESG